MIIYDYDYMYIHIYIYNMPAISINIVYFLLVDIPGTRTFRQFEDLVVCHA